MHRYHFSFGNSNDGPIGYCAAVYADSPQEAVGILKTELEELRAQDGAMISDYGEFRGTGEKGISYVQAYLNEEKVTVDDIDDVEEETDGD